MSLSCFNDLGHDWNTVEHHGREAAQSLRWMQRLANVQSCGVQFDREDAKCSPSEGYNVVATHVELAIDPGVVGFIFQQCHRSATFTYDLEGCEFQRQSTNQFRKGCREEGHGTFCVAGPSERHVRTS